MRLFFQVSLGFVVKDNSKVPRMGKKIITTFPNAKFWNITLYEGDCVDINSTVVIFSDVGTGWLDSI